VDRVEEITKVPGVHVLFIGPRDLSHDLGVPGDTSAPAFQDALKRVAGPTIAVLFKVQMTAHRTARPTLTVLPPSGAAAGDHAPKRSDVELLGGLGKHAAL
jgi:hypothetical protein